MLDAAMFLWQNTHDLNLIKELLDFFWVRSLD